MALADADLQNVMVAWEQLPRPVRTAIAMLVRATVPNLSNPATAFEERHPDREQLAKQVARDCRHIIQDYLPEEEWQDADQEFFEVIAPHL